MRSERFGGSGVPGRSDEELVLSLRDGDPDAFGLLVFRWQEPLFRFVYRILERREDARDVCQETFLRVLRQPDRFQEGARFSTWMYQIALNLCRDQLRRRKRWRFLAPAPPGPDGEPGREREEQDREATSIEALERRERRDAVSLALADLPPEQREVLVLKEFEGLKFREIAEILGCPESTVKSRMYYGLSGLRSALVRRGSWGVAPPGSTPWPPGLSDLEGNADRRAVRRARHRAEREELHGHLRQCGACSAAWEELTAAREALRATDLPVPAAPRLVLFPLRRRAALPFAAGFAAAAVLALGMGVGWMLRGGSPAPPAGSGLSASDRQAVADLIEAKAVEQRRAFEQTLHQQPTPAGLTRDEIAQLLSASERRVDERRATDMRYVLGEIGAAEMRAGASIGETQRALQYVALANNPQASLH